MRRRLVARLRPEVHFDQRVAGPANARGAFFFTRVFKQKSLGHGAYDPQRALGLRVLLVALPSEFFWISHETLDARLFVPPLFRRQRFAVVGDDQAGRGVVGLDIHLCRGPFRRGLGAAEQEMGAVVVGRLDFILHRLAHQIHGIAICRHRLTG